MRGSPASLPLLPPPSTPSASPRPPENMYRWRFGTTPIWVNPAFVDLFYDSVVQDMAGGPILHLVGQWTALAAQADAAADDGPAGARGQAQGSCHLRTRTRRRTRQGRQGRRSQSRRLPLCRLIASHGRRCLAPAGIAPDSTQPVVKRSPVDQRSLHRRPRPHDERLPGHRLTERGLAVRLDARGDDSLHADAADAGGGEDVQCEESACGHAQRTRRCSTC